MGKLIKNNKLLRIQQAKASNTRERNIAKQYFNAGPSIGNLARAAYHWYNSIPGLGGQDESGNIIIGGEAPTPGMRNPKSIIKGIKPAIKIVKKNATKITPAQWTAAQDAAIARGDMAEAQRLRDLHFKVKTPNNTIVDDNGIPLHVYHGTESKPFNIFNINAPRKHDLGTYGKGFYFTPNKTTATSYGNNKTLFDIYLNLTKPYTGSEDVVNNIGNFKNIKELKKYYNQQGFSKKELDTINWGNFNIANGVNAGDEIMVLKPNQIKSAQAITYDDNGVRIPLGKRDNFNINDIRYGLLPIIGGIGLGSYSVDKKKTGGQIVKKFKQKFLFGGKWLNPKTAYGYPVYFSNSVPSEYLWVDKYLKEHPDVTGMAIGGGAQGPEDIGPRVIIRNSYSNILTDPNDKRWKRLDKIEAVRHFMNETNYNPYFKISPEQEYFRKTLFDKNAYYNTDENAWRQSIISRIIAGDMDGTPEQMKEVDKFEKEFYKLKGNGEYW